MGVKFDKMRERRRGNAPERSRDTVSPSNVGRLEKSSSPCPLTDNNTGSKTSLNHTSSGAVVKKEQIEEGSVRKRVNSTKTSGLCSRERRLTYLKCSDVISPLAPKYRLM